MRLSVNNVETQARGHRRQHHTGGRAAAGNVGHIAAIATRPQSARRRQPCIDLIQQRAAGESLAPFSVRGHIFYTVALTTSSILSASAVRS